ncbi:MAG TPA: formate dehydrogenase [Noviherbaspirillum sp.]|uniref:formate dehydrogenase n=1 Tax=Noviherbaspirillum sp. TaxID=1926288 RepID=UPI002B45A0B0|nr:formate dehydrogenase [Noviherbaspirillum sp.]HJV83856.1 formate dehydrogenase [Noviherbaspirillum sp.]
MNKEDLEHNSKIRPRRHFLAAAAGVPALAVAGALMADKSAPASTVAPAAPSASEGPQGYHETEHIRKYYSTAAF